MSRLVISMFLAVLAVLGCATPFQKIKQDQVYLYLKDTSSQSAFFVSSLDGFQQHPMTRHNKKTWFTNLSAEHEFTYFYVIDGQPFTPDCPYKEKDDYGSENCIFVPDL